MRVSSPGRPMHRIYTVAGVLALLGAMASGFVPPVGSGSPRSPRQPPSAPAPRTGNGEASATVVAAAAVLDAPARKRSRSAGLIDEGATLLVDLLQPKPAPRKRSPARAVEQQTIVRGISVGLPLPTPSSSPSPALSPLLDASEASDAAPDVSSPTTEDPSVLATIKSLQLLTAALSVKRKLAAQLGRQPRASEWARKLGLGEEQLEDLVDRGTRARLLLLKSFTPMVHLLVRKHSSGLSSSDKADLVGEGYVGIIRAALKFDPSKGSKFSTFVWFYIRKHVATAAQASSSVMSGRTQADDGQVNELKRATHLLRGLSEAPITTEEMASQLNVTVDRVHVLKRLSRPVVSAEKINMDEMMADVSLPVFSGIITESDKEEVIERCMSRLDPEERFVLAHRAGLVDGVPKSWQDLQQLMEGCGVSYLRKVEMRAKAHLMRDREFSALLRESSPVSVFTSA